MAIIDAADHSLTLAKHVASRALGAAVARMVITRHCNSYNLDGKGATAIDLSRYSDIGAADSVAFGTEYTTESAFASTAVTLTPSRFAKGGVVDKDVYLRRVPGYSAADVEAALNMLPQIMAAPEDVELQTQMIERAFGVEYRQLTASLYETLEIANSTLFASFSASAGTTTVNMTFVNLEDALAAVEGASSLPHENIVVCLAPRQIADLRADARSSSNSGFSDNLTTLLQFQPGIPTQGLRGVALGLPVYQIGPEAVQTANAAADVVGALFLRGEGDPEDSGMGIPGALAVAVGQRASVSAEVKARKFGPELVADWTVASGIRVNNWGCKIVTDA